VATTDQGNKSENVSFPERVVLVVDDDDTTRTLIARWLKSAGFVCKEAASGDETLRMLDADPDAYQAIVLDVMMPGLDGFEVFGRLKKMPKAAHVPVVFLTASASERDIVRGLEAGATDYLLKPFAGPVLVAKMRAVRERLRTEWMLRGKLRSAERHATTDGLTGLLNRRSFDERLTEVTAAALRHREAVALIMLDIDKFKSVNDEHGHPAGDVALRFVADRVRRVLRLGDAAFRYGGEEFAVLLRKCDATGAVAVYDRLREELKREPVALGRDATRLLTVSGGIATLESANGFREGDLVARADAALYEAKHAGRDRAEVEKL
jgi:two-component system cell cycle response regulator